MHVRSAVRLITQALNLHGWHKIVYTRTVIVAGCVRDLLYKPHSYVLVSQLALFSCFHTVTVVYMLYEGQSCWRYGIP